MRDSSGMTSEEVWERLWAPGTGLMRCVVDEYRDPDHAALIDVLDQVPRVEVFELELVRALWTIPLCYLHRLRAAGKCDWGLVLAEFDAMFERPGTRVAEYEMLRAFWDSRQDGFLGMLRRPERGYSAAARERFMQFLDQTPAFTGPVAWPWIDRLADAPLRCWSCWRRGGFEEHMALQKELVPKLMRIFGEPYPGHGAELLAGSNLTPADKPN